MLIRVISGDIFGPSRCRLMAGICCIDEVFCSVFVYVFVFVASDDQVRQSVDLFIGQGKTNRV